MIATNKRDVAEHTSPSRIARQRPNNDDLFAWRVYWQELDHPWRTEPEIEVERQHFLAERRRVTPDVKHGIYPFEDIALTRADVEWLLATHENGRGPVDWNDASQRNRQGLDLRGGNLSQADLSYLPLARIYAGLDKVQWQQATKRQRQRAAVQMKGTNLQEAHLEGALLLKADLKDAFLMKAHMEGADLRGAYLEGANLQEARLDGASLCSAFFDEGTLLKNTSFGNKPTGFVSLDGLRWGHVNLGAVRWSQVEMVGEEQRARQKLQDGKVKERALRIEEYEEAVRATRQLAGLLQAQGLHEEAARFTYRAQKLQRVVLRRQRKGGKYLFSGFLDLLAGYGYLPERSLFWYVLIIVGFAFLYHALGNLSLFPPDAFVYSLTSFHGRGFFPGLETKPSLHSPLVMLAAVEAVVGLFIEISFIATFTQRFFDTG